MRSAQRDQGGLTTFSSPLIDGTQPGGSFVANGVSCSWTRSGTGTYTISFDTRLRTVGGVASTQSVAYIATVSGVNPGTASVATFNNTFAAANGFFFVTITALDKRT